MPRPPRIDVRPAVDALRLALTDRDLRRLTISWFATNFGKWAFLVTNLVVAYDAGGAPALGALGLARYLVPTLVAPFAGVPVARWRAERVLLAMNTVRTIAIALAVVVIGTGAPIGWLFVVVALEAGAGALTRPLTMALLPCVARTPAQLVAANVAAGVAEGLGTFLGPALAGLLLATAGPVGADVAVLLIYLGGLVVLMGVDVPVVGRVDGSAQAVLHQLSAGLRTVRSTPGPRLVFIGFGLQTFVRGLLMVLVVVAAVEVLAMGDPGVGTLNAAMGLGALVGAFAAVMLTGRDRLAPAFTVAMIGWGAPIAVIGLLIDPFVAIGSMVVIGMSNALIDVAGFTLAQRTSSNDSRVAVLGLLDAAANAGVALGGLVAPLLLEALGIRGALIVTGAILPIAAILAWPSLRRLDEGGEELGRRSSLLRGVPLFSPLSLATVDYLAARLQPRSIPIDSWLMREGEPGDAFFLIETGQLRVSRGGVELRVVGPGDGVGEIALLRSIPRTASIQAVVPCTVLELDREAFLEAVTGSATSLRAAADVVDAHLERDARSPESGTADAAG